MSVIEAVERDIDALPNVLQESGLAATALALASMVDDAANSATSRSMCAKELRETLARLRELAPPVRELDSVDDLATRRAVRRAAASGEH